MTKLPEKFSAGIRLAVEDMKKCEADPRYVINMEIWHTTDTGKCFVCMAGSVMAQTLNIDFQDNAVPSQFRFLDLRDKLLAFDDLRMGYIISAFQRYTGEPRCNIDIKDIPEYTPYEDDKEKFYNWCLAVADEFERIGE